MSKFSCAIALLAGAVGTPTARAQSPVAETILANLGNGGSDAGYPGAGPLTLGLAKTMFGTAAQGGANQLGAVFSVTPAGTETLLHSFAGDDGRPGWGVVRDAAGNLYGTDNGGSQHKGFVFELSKTGSYKILHSFASDGSEGELINNGVTLGADGFLYGFASAGGNPGGGTFYCMAKNGTQFAVLYTFAGHGDGTGFYPGPVPTQGPDGAFYGVLQAATDLSGQPLGWAIARLTSTGAASFILGLPDAVEAPNGTVAIDAAGNLYAVAGARNSVQTGRIYRITPAGAITVLHQFSFADGVPGPYNQCLLLAKDGRLYGTASNGGANGTSTSDNIGTVFGLNTDGSGFAVLHNFADSGGDGFNPEACPAQAADGSLWGTSFYGGSHGGGIVYQLAKPAVTLTVKPTKLALGGSATLAWSSMQATSCTISGPGVSSNAASGSISITPAATGMFSYSAICSGAGSMTKIAKITVD